MALESVITYLVLDVIDHDQIQGVIKAIALDSKTRFVKATLVQHGIDYPVDENATVTLTILRPDNVGVQVTGSVVDVDNADRTGTIKGVYAELTQAALAKSGTLKAQFKMTVGEQILRTEIFAIKNGIALDAETDTWTDYEGYNLDELVQELNSAVAKVNALEGRVETLEESGTGGSGVPTSVKQAILTLFKSAAYTETGLTDEIATVESWATSTSPMTGINAVYSGGTVTAGASLDSLRSDLTVTAEYADESVSTVTDYTLSGTLTAGTSTITVGYGGFTTTFTVTVTAADELWINGLATGSTASFVYAPFVLPTGTYDYDYSKQITAIEGNFSEAGVISIGYYTGTHADGTTIDDSNIHITEVLTVSATGQKKLTLANPLSIPSGSALLIGAGTDTATFAYGGSLSNGFVYRNYTNKFKAQSKKLGMNVYRR